AGADTQRGQDLAERCSSGALRLPWVLIRPPLSLQDEWPISWRKPVHEERATAQDESARAAGARQQRSMAGSARHAEQISARLVELLLPWDASTGIPRRRLLCPRARACIPRQTAQSGRARQPPVLIRRTAWRTRGAVPRTPAMICPDVYLAVKPVGEPYAVPPHVRSDERGGETGRCQMAQATAPTLDSTRPPAGPGHKRRRSVALHGCRIGNADTSSVTCIPRMDRIEASLWTASTFPTKT